MGVNIMGNNVLDDRKNGFAKLTVWQKSYALTLDMYQITKQFPRNELFGLISQIRRAAVSISANIAEGYGR